MTGSPIPRREFFRRAALAGAAICLAREPALGQPPAGDADESNRRRESLNETEWRTLEAITARILPTGDRPGALEAGCIWFIDRVLAHEESDQRALYATGLLGVEAFARARFARAFVELDDRERDELLALVEAGDVEAWPAAGAGRPAAFFAAVRRHVILGFLSDPSYGGNRNFAGWRAAGHPGPRHHRGAKLAAPATAQQLVGGQKIIPIWDDTTIRTRFL